MKRRIIGAMVFLGALGGCMSTDTPPETGGVRPHYGKSFGPPMVPGLEGPYGTGVPMAAPYNMMPPVSKYAAAGMMNNNMPMNMVQMNPMGMPMGGPPGAGMPSPMAPGNMLLSPPNMPPMPGMSPGGFGPGGPGMPMPPMGPMGPMPPMGPMGPMPPTGPMGPMPPNGPMGPMGGPLQKASFTSTTPDAGLMTADVRPGASTGNLMQAYVPGGAVGGAKQAQFADAPPPGGGVMPAQFSNSSPVGSMFPAQRTQVYFGNPVRMKIYWFTQGPDGKPNYSTTPLETPGRYNFAQAAIYRLKLTNIPGRPALELYPTLEVVPTSPRTNEFLAHNSVPVDFSEEDFKQVVDRNYIVKVIYLPDPQNQDGAGAGPGEISSTQLEPGQDPIQEALRRGSILLVLRIGNIDQGLQHTPPMTSPGPSAPPGMMKPPGAGVQPFMQVPFNMPPITPGGMLPPPNQLPPLNVPPGGNPNLNQNPNKLALPPLPPPPNLKPSEELKLPAPGVIPPPPPNLKPSEELKLPAPGVIPPPPPNLKPSEEVKVPAIPLPVPGAAPNNEKPLIPPLPLPGPGSSSVPSNPNPPVVPASTGKENTPRAPAMPPVPIVTLPELPSSLVDPLGLDQPPLPSIPVPAPEKK
jgi:hypothetical protein